MRVIPTALAIIGVAAVLASVPPRNASAQILAVDFGLTTANFPEAGFQTFLLPNPGVTSSPSQVFGGLSGVASGSITVAFAGTPGGRERGQPTGGGNPNLFRDLFTALAETTTGTTFSLSGLDPSTQYQIEIWSLDRGFNNGAVYEWFNTTGGTSTLLGTITNSTTAVPADLTEFRVLSTVTSSASGGLTFGQNDPVGNGTINGFRISAAAAAVPEPSAFVLFGGAATIATLVARRRRSHA